MEFREEEAIQYGVNEAIMISNFRYWIAKNKANGKHEHNGRTWTYNSNKAFNEIFKFWSEKQIRTILKSLQDKNIIQTGNYNKAGFDRTKWYSFVDETKFLSIGRNGQMDLPKWANGSAQMGEPIPNRIPNRIPNNIYYNEVNFPKLDKITGKVNKKKFIKPTIEEIKAYCKERKNNVDAETFFDFYESKGWVVGKSSMKDWKAAVRTWERNKNKTTKQKTEPVSPYQNYEDYLKERGIEYEYVEGFEDW